MQHRCPLRKNDKLRTVSFPFFRQFQQLPQFRPVSGTWHVHGHSSFVQDCHVVLLLFKIVVIVVEIIVILIVLVVLVALAACSQCLLQLCVAFVDRVSDQTWVVGGLPKPQQQFKHVNLVAVLSKVFSKVFFRRFEQLAVDGVLNATAAHRAPYCTGMHWWQRHSGAR
jgi:hypothetical protein